MSIQWPHSELEYPSTMMWGLTADNRFNINYGDYAAFSLQMPVFDGQLFGCIRLCAYFTLHYSGEGVNDNPFRSDDYDRKHTIGWIPLSVVF